MPTIRDYRSGPANSKATASRAASAEDIAVAIPDRSALAQTS
jgi:hypothetical protein